MLTVNFAAGSTWRNSHRKSEGAVVLRTTNHRRGNSKSRFVNSKSAVPDNYQCLLFTVDDVLEELNGPALQQCGRYRGLQDPKNKKGNDG